MLTIHEEPDCGNAPRKLILRNLVVALATQDSEYVDSLLSDDVVWDLVGGQVLMGRDAIREWITSQGPVDAVTFGTFLTHGRGAGVDGSLDLADGPRSRFCHVLRFAGAARTAKVIGVNSYIIRAT
ncbi:nuclear transport factor 2 family protein [Homoserinimonas sp. OAct 916]|uniref:nuclear transport factor 2 family protein n=1 Tax=Homoserinimonas sp. OAct 916 TaxID=2211450 RepID=UPI000DBE69DB|nr:nuclear transport factor 2 family protein [Homoserinimonas sp. OAct 916]